MSNIVTIRDVVEKYPDSELLLRCTKSGDGHWYEGQVLCTWEYGEGLRGCMSRKEDFRDNELLLFVITDSDSIVTSCPLWSLDSFVSGVPVRNLAGEYVNSVMNGDDVYKLFRNKDLLFDLTVPDGAPRTVCLRGVAESGCGLALQVELMKSGIQVTTTVLSPAAEYSDPNDYSSNHYLFAD